ncbi:MAG: hypothetical protein U0Q12_03470 [Vicinamibacterales bacterium]
MPGSGGRRIVAAPAGALALGLGRAPAVAVAAHDPLAMLLASAAWGAIGVLALRHRERSSPQWWDAWEAALPAGATAPSALGPNASRHAREIATAICSSSRS